MKTIECTIEKLVNMGEALGFYDNTAVFAWNALPGERVLINPYSRKKDFIRGIVEKICAPSKHRIAPSEPHYLSCSPWQILSYEQENLWKGIIAKEMFKRFAEVELDNTAVVHDSREYGYRNKMEYSFWEENNKLSLAFFVRGKNRRTPIEPCVLAQKPINRAAVEILEWMNGAGLSRRDIKTLILRSGDDDQVIASLLFVDRETPKPTAPFQTLNGFSIYSSNPRSPASIPLALLYHNGATKLKQTVLGTRLNFGVFNFFQINVLLFERALQKIAEHLDGEKIVDFYSGVGAISIPLSKNISEAILVESDSSAINFAKQTIEELGLKNYTTRNGTAESLLSEIQKNRTIIIDPPRAGLHKDIITELLKTAPRRIIYLSCDIASQARDTALLLPKYNIIYNELYNFFPRTPHIESLIIMDAK